MDKATQQANRTIAILSPDYFTSHFTSAEWAAAYRRDPTGELGVLVPVRVRPCDVHGLLGSIVYIDLVDQQDDVARATLLAGVQTTRLKPANAPFSPIPTVPHPSITQLPERPSFPGALQLI